MRTEQEIRQEIRERNRTRVVNLRVEDYDEYIGRGSIWGNPYSHKHGTKAQYVVGSRQEAIDKYREYVLNRPDLMSELITLDGKVLGCYCKPLACHGDVLLELLEDHKVEIRLIAEEYFDEVGIDDPEKKIQVLNDLIERKEKERDEAFRNEIEFLGIRLESDKKNEDE